MSNVYNMLKPREIREALRGKIDPAIGKILVDLCEDARENRRLIVEVAKMLDQYADTINSMMNINDALRKQHEARFGKLSPPKTALDTARETVGPEHE